METALPSIGAAREKKRKRNRRLLSAAACLALLYASGFAFFDHAMHQPPEKFSRVMMHAGPIPFLLFPFETMWKSARAGHLSPGDPAPDFTLPLLDHSQQVTLSSFRGVKPVVLVFGSYT
ncbi:MAG: redoxin domain-containing protein [Acidobacteriaceae bacterium]|nr:redoxin domain-containing protein [Acidobacteriaceae bacterium]